MSPHVINDAWNLYQYVITALNVRADAKLGTVKAADLINTSSVGSQRTGFIVVVGLWGFLLSTGHTTYNYVQLRWISNIAESMYGSDE